MAMVEGFQIDGYLWTEKAIRELQNKYQAQGEELEKMRHERNRLRSTLSENRDTYQKVAEFKQSLVHLLMDDFEEIR